MVVHGYSDRNFISERITAETAEHSAVCRRWSTGTDEADQERKVKPMNQTNLIILYLDAVATSAETLTRIICNSDKADMIASTVIVLLDTEDKTENDILLMELDSIASDAVKVCFTRLLECNKAAVRHLEKFQLQGYHFEELIHSLKLENQTLSEEIHFA